MFSNVSLHITGRRSRSRGKRRRRKRKKRKRRKRKRRRRRRRKKRRRRKRRRKKKISKSIAPRNILKAPFRILLLMCCFHSFPCSNRPKELFVINPAGSLYYNWLFIITIPVMYNWTMIIAR